MALAGLAESLGGFTIGTLMETMTLREFELWAHIEEARRIQRMEAANKEGAR